MRSASLLFFLPLCALHVVSQSLAYDESLTTMQEGSNKTDFEGYRPTVDGRLAAPPSSPTSIVEILNIELPLINVGPLSKKETDELLQLKADWLMEFYHGRCDCDVLVEMDFVEQEVTFDQLYLLTNTITYSLRLNFDNCGTSPSIDGLTREAIVSLPYENFDANFRLASTLRATVDSLSEMHVPLSIPKVPILYFFQSFSEVSKREQVLAVDHRKDASNDLLPPHASGHVSAVSVLVLSQRFSQIKMSATRLYSY
jgi:hypothetical protein